MKPNRHSAKLLISILLFSANVSLAQDSKSLDKMDEIMRQANQLLGPIGTGSLMEEKLENPLFKIQIERNMTCKDNSTIGSLMVNGTEIGRTLELPWKNNESDISRMPPGDYDAKIRTDGKRKWRIELENVKDRKWIQLHVGNWQHQIEGCVLVGENVVNDNGRCMITKSRVTLEKLASEMSKYSADMGGNFSSPINISVEVR